MIELKNIQVIDAADNCSYSIFQATASEFEKIFPGEGQDIEYIEDFYERQSDRADEILSSIWQRPIKKKDTKGIHGTLYYGMQNRKQYYVGKREKDLDPMYMNEAQRRLYRVR